MERTPEVQVDERQILAFNSNWQSARLSVVDERTAKQ